MTKGEKHENQWSASETKDGVPPAIVEEDKNYAVNCLILI